MSKIIKEIKPNTFEDYTLEIEHKTLEVRLIAYVNSFKELYGADYDGNRGEVRSFSEVEFLKILDYRGNDLTEKIYTNYKHEYDSVIDYLEELNNY